MNTGGGVGFFLIFFYSHGVTLASNQYNLELIELKICLEVNVAGIIEKTEKYYFTSFLAM